MTQSTSSIQILIKERLQFDWIVLSFFSILAPCISGVSILTRPSMSISQFINPNLIHQELEFLLPAPDAFLWQLSCLLHGFCYCTVGYFCADSIQDIVPCYYKFSIFPIMHHLKAYFAFIWLRLGVSFISDLHLFFASLTLI